MTKAAFERLLQQDKKVDWNLFISRHQEYSPAFSYLILASKTPAQWTYKTTEVAVPMKFFKRLGGDFYHSSSDIKKIQKYFSQKGVIEPLFYIRIIKNVEVYCDTLIEWCQIIEKMDFNTYSNGELENIYNVYWQNLKNAASFMSLKHILNQVLEKSIRKKLKKIPEGAAKEHEIFDQLLVPRKDTLLAQAHKELYNLASQKNVTISEQNRWLKKYDWIETFTWLGDLLDSESFNDKLTLMKNEKQAKEYTKELRELKVFMLQNFSLFTDIQALQYLLYFHTYELECLFAAHYKARNLIEVIGSRIGLTYEEIPYAVYPEVVDGLKGKQINKRHILSRRGNQVAMYLLDEEITVVGGELFKKIRYIKNDNNTQKSLIKGTPAFLGKVQGRVVVVKTKKDFSKFTGGEILITPMTTIDFTPYLKKVKAIVTDEGGVTCHAAIIARELKIPCVIGTKIATHVLKDGDIVEVDAMKGIVKILNSS